MRDTAIVDVDGTLVDTNYQHALAWYRAFRRFGITLDLWRIHRAIGMGGDQLVAHIAGPQVEDEYGAELRQASAEEFDQLIDEISPFEGAVPLLEELKARRFRLVLASSGQRRHVEHFLELIDGKKIADAWTTADDVQASKPHPDLVAAALVSVAGARGVMIGDSTWDALAAGKLDLPTLAVRTGGFGRDELLEAGATAVFDSLGELQEHLDATPLREAGHHAM